MSDTQFRRDAVYLVLTSFEGVSVGAKHWYARLTCKDPKKDVRVMRILNQQDVDELNADYREAADSVTRAAGAGAYGESIDRTVFEDLGPCPSDEEIDALGEAPEDGRYRVGDTSERFSSREAAFNTARSVWRLEFPNAKILIHGDPCYADPVRILEGPSPFIEQANALYAASEAAGFWEGDKKKMEEICAKWDALIEGYGK